MMASGMPKKQDPPGWEVGPVDWDGSSPAPQGEAKTSQPVGRQSALSGEVETLHSQAGSFIDQLLSGTSRDGSGAHGRAMGRNVAQGLPAAGSGPGTGMTSGKGAF